MQEALFDLPQPRLKDVGTKDERTEWTNAAGDIHREDGPALIWAKGVECWMQHGEFHRIGGPAIIYTNGGEEWYEYDRLHRIGGPAMIKKNSEAWYQDGKLHRLDGPAVIRKTVSGEIIHEYWNQGVCLKREVTRVDGTVDTKHMI